MGKWIIDSNLWWACCKKKLEKKPKAIYISIEQTTLHLQPKHTRAKHNSSFSKGRGTQRDFFFKWNDSFIYTLVHLILNGCEEKRDLKARLAIVRCGFVFCSGVEPTNTRKLANSFVTFGVNQANLPVMQISLKPSSLMIVL